MFKEPERHIPREWGQVNMPRAVATAAGIVIALTVLAFVPYGGEIALVLGGIVFAVALCRRGV